MLLMVWTIFATIPSIKLNSSDRIRSVLHFRQTDRLPVAPEMIAVAATLAGVPVVDYVKNGDVLAQCQLEAMRNTGSDVMFAISDLCIEAEALGCELTFPEHNYPHIKTKIVEHPSDIERLDIPDPRCDGRMPEIIKALRLLKDESKGSVPVIANVIGPLTLAARIMDIEKMLYMIVDHPDQFKIILDFCLQVSLAFAETLIQEGADGIMVFDPAASPAVMPAKLFVQLESARVRKIFSEVKALNPNTITWYSVAGPVQTNPAIITSVCPDVTTIDYPVPMESMLQYSDCTTINGNIKPEMFLDGSQRDVYLEARALLKITRETERFIVGSGCEIPLFSKLDNIKALYNAVMDEAEDFERIHPSEGNKPEVTFLPHKKKIVASSGDTILDSARKAGIAITTFCGVPGACGECVIHTRSSGLSSPDELELHHLTRREGGNGERLACVAKIKDNINVYIPYSSRRFPDRMSVPDELYDNSIDEQLSKHSFSPIISSYMMEASSIPEPSTTTFDDWVTSNFEGCKISLHSKERLADLLQAEINSKVYFIKDNEKSEIIDVSRSRQVYGLAMDISDSSVTIYAHNLADGKLECVASVGNPLLISVGNTRLILEKLRKDPSLIDSFQKDLVNCTNNIISWYQNKCSVTSDSIYNVVIVGSPVMYDLFRGHIPGQGINYEKTTANELYGNRSTTEWVSLTASSINENVKLSVNKNCRIDFLPTGAFGTSAGPAATILASGMNTQSNPALFVVVGDSGTVALKTGDTYLCTSMQEKSLYAKPSPSMGSVSQNGLVFRAKLHPDGETSFETLQGSAPIGICGSALIEITSEFVKRGVIDKNGSFAGDRMNGLVSNDQYVLIPKHKTAMYSPITVSSTQIQSTMQAASSYQSVISSLIEGACVEADSINTVIVGGAFGVLVDIPSAKNINMIPDTPRSMFGKNTDGLGARLCLLSLSAREEVVRISVGCKYEAMSDNIINQN